MKKLLLCICSAALLLGCMCACTEDEEYDYSNDWYLVEECSEGTISGSSAEPWFDDEIVVCNSVAQLKSYVNSDFDYDDDFFTSNSLLLIQFTYARGEGNIEFEVLTSHDSKLYPVFSFATEATTGDSKLYLLFSVEVSNTLTSAYEPGNILVIDNYYAGMGGCILNKDSAWHTGFKGVFAYYDHDDAY